MPTRAFATVITRSYLPFARVLAQSIRRFHDDPIYVVCVDDPGGYFDPSREPFTVLTAQDLLPVEDRNLLFYYTPFEACNALRAYLHNYLLERTSHDRWLYLDSDIFVTAPLDLAFDAMNAPASGVISPHCTQPAPVAIMEPVETSLQKHGIYNSGFLALRRCSETQEFATWFVQRLRSLCFFMHRDVYVDQLWLNFVPEYFPAMLSWKHPGANVGYWNLHERTLTRSPSGFLANGQTLLFVHFSRWLYEAPDNWAFGRPTTSGTDPSIISELGLQYRDALSAAGYDECRGWPYGFATFADGRPITTQMRRRYYEMMISDKAGPESPFEHSEWFPPRWTTEVVRKMLPQRLKNFVRSMIS
jgi:hypothetical protein